MKKIKAIFVDVINRQVSEVEIEENLQSYYTYNIQEKES